MPEHHAALPPVDDDDAIERWIALELIALDSWPHQRYWRHRAVGMTMAEALSNPDLRDVRIDVRVPVTEARIVNEAARRRDLPTRTYVRRALASILVICDRYEPEDLPVMAAGGFIAPHER